MQFSQSLWPGAVELWSLKRRRVKAASGLQILGRQQKHKQHKQKKKMRREDFGTITSAFTVKWMPRHSSREVSRWDDTRSFGDFGQFKPSKGEEGN